MSGAAVTHRMTVEEYLAFVDTVGLDAVELVNGVVYDVSPEGPAHSDAAVNLLFLLAERFGDRRVKNAGSVRLDDRTLVQPDVYVLDLDRNHHFAPGDDYPGPDLLLLAVEVSLTTRGYDIGPKLAAYAAAGVGEYWVVHPAPGGYALRFTEPRGSAYVTVARLELPEGTASLDVLRRWR